MVIRVNLRIAKILLQYTSSPVAYLKEIKTKSGKYRVTFGFAVAPDSVVHYTTDYLTSKTSYRFMCSVV